MTDIPKLNGKNWLNKGLLQVLIIVSLIAYIGVKELTSNGSSGASERATQRVTERIVRLEECVRRLDSVPEDIATLKAETRNIVATIDRIEKKLDER